MNTITIKAALTQALEVADRLRHALSNALQSAPKDVWPKWLAVRDECDAEVSKLRELTLSINGLTDAARDVLAERQRQIGVEGWSPGHDDDEHDRGDLAAAASAYALDAADKLNPYSQGDGGFDSKPPPMWCWSFQWWKPGDPRRNLVKAGALILAEIERLDRAAAKGGAQ